MANDESQADSTSVTPTISDDGQVVAFTSSASNLVPGDVNLSTDVFVRDIAAGTTISVTSVPLGQYSATADPNISGNGRYVAFVSDGDNIVPNDTNNSSDVFVFDRDTGTTTRVSVASDGTEGNAGGFDAHLSSNGRYVSFSSWSDNLAPNDANGPYGADVFVRDNVTGQTSRVSESSSGMSGNADSHESDISRDGHVVAFSSDATNLVSGDENGFADIYYKLLP
ncbi:MAG: PD40 domain-containing protein [Acidimicrobiia bacterium]|nr:PD40 domain-containing protein [Acidimicrobiia bacterium]